MLAKIGNNKKNMKQFFIQGLTREGALPVINALVRQIPPVLNGLNVLLAIDTDPSSIAGGFPTPLLVLTARGGQVVIGPVFEPGMGICPTCLAWWMKTARAQDVAPDRAGDVEFHMIASILEEVHGRSAADHALMQTQVCVIDIASSQRSWHTLFPRRNCPDCARIPITADTPLSIHCSSRFGIVQQVFSSKEPFAGAWRTSATWNSPLPFDRSRPPLSRQTSSGRGCTREQSVDGCIGEALERYSIIYRGDESMTSARLCDINAIDPRSILQYSAAQYTNRHEWNRTQDDRYFVGKPFDPSIRADWLPARDVMSGTTTHVAAACALMWYQFPPGEPEFARADSIGCACGRTREDALLAALLEAIERDAVAIWWYNRAHRPALRIDPARCPELASVRSGLREIGRELILLDCTTDITIPTYVAIAARPDGSEPFFAAAADLSPNTAALRAATEVGQMWFEMMLSGSADSELFQLITRHTSAELDYLQGYGEVEPPPEPATLDSHAAVHSITRHLNECGLRAFEVDLSRDDVLLKAVRAVVPGLCHVWNRRAAERLYRVPVRLGWSTEIPGEGDLNPIPCML